MILDRKIIDIIGHVTPEEQKSIMKLLDVLKHEPETKLAMAIFRDVYMFKQMSQAFMLQYKSKLCELESRINELENKEGEQ